MDFQKDLRAVIVNMKNDVPLRLGLKHVRVNDWSFFLISGLTFVLLLSGDSPSVGGSVHLQGADAESIIPEVSFCTLDSSVIIVRFKEGSTLPFAHLVQRKSYLCRQPSCVPATAILSDMKQQALNALEPDNSKSFRNKKQSFETVELKATLLKRLHLLSRVKADTL